MLAAADDETTGAAAEESCCGGDESEAEAEHENIPWQLWDMARPLEGSCKLQILKFDSPEAQNVFWHSSAHILGRCCFEVSASVRLVVALLIFCGFNACRSLSFRSPFLWQRLRKFMRALLNKVYLLFSEFCPPVLVFCASSIRDFRC